MEAGDELPYVPVHSGQVKLGVDHGMGGGLISVSHVAEMRDSAGRGAQTHRTHSCPTVLDLSLYLLPTRSGRLYLGTQCFGYSLHGVETTFELGLEEAAGKPRLPAHPLGSNHAFLISRHRREFDGLSS